MADKELFVYMDGAKAGIVAQSAQGNTTFDYDEDYRRSANPTPLSLSMPLTRERHPSRVVVPFLQGLLPDNEARLARLAAEYRTSTSPFALLSYLGRDAAGAIQLLPPGVDSDDAAVRRGRIQRLSAADFSELIRDVVENSDTWGSRSGAEARWSLPGAQPKIALFRFDDGTWGVPDDSTPTTHILKPAVRPYADHDINEHVTMGAAERLGLDVADHGIVTTHAGDRVFVTRRYDRVEINGRWARLHQEDVCQALSVPPAKKYQSDGGPGVAQIAELLRGSIPDLDARRRAQEQFFGALVFSVSAACTDAHAKNYSLLLSGRSVRLAPLYDLGTHAPYPASAPLKGAMRIGGEYRLDAISKRDLVTVAHKLSLDEDWAERRVDEIRNGVTEAFAGAASLLEAPFAQTVADAVAAIATSRGWSS
ncbi:type II toxin-antitoxin system HipA family toxin [Compostimonas suwonensis]|uniref:Serine/threonine-protein kinase HipA n=1 Tax=Compostimonas suwonensis TaxID=1048394 RepID=A0A2M9BVN5_9MICO|nr:type II toxin-antitoxin system HipA family toxin [Compostimonas suwonensis]PJJ62001.1 serine/threonine-protein kinase HipA [Compostimonas suwonensis]